MCAKAYGCGWPLDLRAKLVMLLHDIYMSVLGAKSAADTIVTLRVLICQRMPSEQVLREVIQQAMNSVRRRYHPNRSLELLKHLLTTPCPTESANLPGEAASSEPLDLADLNRELAIVDLLMSDLMHSGDAAQATPRQPRLPLQLRLQVLQVLLSDVDITLTPAQVDALWAAYAGDRAQGPKLLKWLSLAAGWQGYTGDPVPHAFDAFEPAVLEHVFTSKLCAQDPRTWSQHHCLCFKRMFLQLNTHAGKVAVDTVRAPHSHAHAAAGVGNLRVVDADLLFMDNLWRVVLRAPRAASEGAQDLVATLIFHCDESTVRDRLLALVFAKLKEFSMSASAAGAGAGAGGGDGAGSGASDSAAGVGEQSGARACLRLLPLLWRYFDNFADAASTVRQHGHCAGATRIAVTVSCSDVRQLGSPSSKRRRMHDHAPPVVGPQPQVAAIATGRRRSARQAAAAARGFAAMRRVTVVVSSHDRMEALQRAVARAVGATDARCLQFSMPQGTSPRDPLPRHVLRGGVCACSITTAPTHLRLGADGPLPAVDVTVATGGAMGSSQRSSATAVVVDRPEFMDTMFAMASHPHEALSVEAWLLLQTLPTSSAELHACASPQACVPPSVAPAAAAAANTAAACARDVYRMQAACLFLLPPCDPPVVVQRALAAAVPWRARFAASGAIDRVLHHVTEFQLAHHIAAAAATSSWPMRRFVACLRMAYCYLVVRPLGAPADASTSRASPACLPATPVAAAGSSPSPPTVGGTLQLGPGSKSIGDGDKGGDGEDVLVSYSTRDCGVRLTRVRLDEVLRDVGVVW